MDSTSGFKIFDTSTIIVAVNLYELGRRKIGVQASHLH